MTRALIVLVALATVAACGATDDWSPAAQHARADLRRADLLAAHLQTLLGVTHASVVIDAPRADPLAPPTPLPAPRASVVLAVAPGTDPVATEHAARRAVAAGVTGLAERDVAVTVAVAAPRPRHDTVWVGPFEVARDSRAPLVATLATTLVAIAALAAWLARLLQARRGTRAQ